MMTTGRSSLLALVVGHGWPWLKCGGCPNCLPLPEGFSGDWVNRYGLPAGCASRWRRKLAARYRSRIVAYTKKVHLHNDARARHLPELHWVRCAPTSASRENAPFGCSSPSMPPPPPDTGRCVALSSAISPSSWGRTIIRSQLVRSPKIHRMVRPIRSRSKRMRRTICSIFGR